MPHIARQLQHEVPMPPLDAASARTSTSDPMGLQQTSPTGAESKVGLEMMPIDGVTLSDGRALGERARTRRYLKSSLGCLRCSFTGL
jgi:hypothetical protein